MTISVVLPLPVDQAYTYEVPAALVGEVRVGSRVVVPFGRRVLTGIVVGEGDAAEGRRLKPIQDVLDEEPAFTPEMLRLTRWMADYYLCSWGEAVRAALPAGIEVESKRLLHRADADPSGPLATEVARILEDAGALSVEHLSTRASASVTLSFVRRLAEQGVVRIQTELVPPKVSVKTERTLHLAPALRDEHAFADALDVLRGDRQKSLLRTVAQAGDTLSQPAALKRAGATSSTANSLVKKGFLEAGERELIRTPLGELPAVTGPPPARTLHPAQAEALQTIKAAISAERYEAFLLHGVTGSGKTEVYIAALKQTLDAGKSGIVLVPEIALTPQTVLRFRRHFGDEVAVLHSRMSAGERYDAWRQIRAGTRRVVIGPRSAVLAPVERVGLIVVDEEHESSYKQFDPAPRYHARDVAVWRAH
ncbi:MAG: DEAD/DEAH box helicase, partial [Bacteroidota bacterium]